MVFLVVGIFNVEPMILLFQILYTDFDVFVDFQSRIVHFSQSIILLCQILVRGGKHGTKICMNKVISNPVEMFV